MVSFLVAFFAGAKERYLESGNGIILLEKVREFDMGREILKYIKYLFAARTDCVMVGVRVGVIVLTVVVDGEFSDFSQRP